MIRVRTGGLPSPVQTDLGSLCRPSGFGQHGERLPRRGAEHPEVSTVQRKQTVCFVTVSEDDQRGVCHADVLILVSVDHAAHPSKVDRLDRRELPGASRQLVEDGQFGIHPTASRQQVVQLRDDIGRHDEWTWLSLDDRRHLGAVSIARIKIREESARVADEHDQRSPKPASASSVRSDSELSPLAKSWPRGRGC